MRRILAVAFGTAVAVGLGLLLFPSGRDRPEGPAERAGDGPEPTEAAAPGERRSVLEEAKLAEREDPPAKPAVEDDDAPRSRFAIEVSEQAPALSGLDVSAVGAGDRERLKIPEDWGTGVLIERVHPDAPAAEAGLRKGDVIVRAMREDVNAPSDLERVVGQREHTVLIAVRDGQTMQLVIQRPFEGGS